MYKILLILLLATSAHADPKAIQTIALEASGESFAGQVAVASVIKTRMAKRRQTAYQVVTARRQFSCFNQNSVRKLSKKELETAQRAWEQARIGKYNHYCRHDCTPYWIQQAKSKKRTGAHIFYEL